MKNISSFLVLVLMTAFFVGCGGKADSSDGVYEGVGEGKGGDLKVEVKIEDLKITDIKILEESETAGYAASLSTLINDVIKYNSTDVDTVSGSTLSSNGLMEAIQDALDKAGIDPKDLKQVKIEDEDGEKEEVSEEYDVIVVGAGGAGLAAAIEAKMDGADVLVVEKMPIAGGNTLISGAEYAAPGNWIQEKEGIEDTPELMIEDTLEGGDHINDRDLVTVVAENALEDAIWLRDEIGVIWEDELMFFGGHSVKRSLIPLGASGREIINKQVAKAEELEIPIYLETKAEELIMEDGKVTGVKAESNNKIYTLTAKNGVIIASGGFGSNIDMRVKYNPEIDDKILSTNTVGSTGDGITMGEAVNAELVDMEWIQTYPICDPLTGTLLYFDDARLFGHTVIVNKEGKRFVEELGRRDVMSMAIKEQTGSVCYEIIDENGYVESKLEQNHKPELDYLFENDLLVKADTLEEAAEKFDLNVDEVVASVERYNTYVEDGEDPEFNKRSLPSKLEKGPFYILKAAPAVHHTMGGLKINTNAEVVDTAGNVIEGLFAAGEVTGGIHGKNRLGSNALADIIVFGRTAGRNAAAK